MRNRLICALFFVAALRCTMPPATPSASSSETIFAGGLVVAGPAHTPQKNWSVVVSGEHIVAVGPADEIRSAHPAARVIDVTGATILPGLTDAHGHLYGLGLSLDTVSLVGAASFDEVVARVKQRAERAQPGEWILGRGWDQNRWPVKEFPTSAALDAAIPDHPVWLRRVDGHAGVANTAALRAAGVTASTRDPEGGRIVRDASGNPSGTFVDAAMGLVDTKVPPPSPELRWSPPTLTSPTVRHLTQANHSVPVGSGDLSLICDETLSTAIGQIEGWNDVVTIGGAIVGGSTNSQGHIVPRELTGTFHWEGWKVQLTTYADAFTSRWRAPVIQIQGCYIEVTKANSSMHSDGFQTQEAIIGQLYFDRCTIKTDYQGIFLSNEPQNQGPAPSKVDHQILSRLLFLQGVQGQPATYFFKAFPPRPTTSPPGPTEMYDVWMPALNAGTKAYPSSNFSSWAGGSQKFGSFVTTKVHPVLGSWPFLRFSTSADTVPTGTYAGQQAGDCQVGGDGGIWLYNNLAEVPDDVGAPTDAGMSYVSPGYQ